MALQINKYFQEAVKQNASDLYLIGDEKVFLRIHGVLKIIDEKPLKDTDLQSAIFALISDNQKSLFDKELELDFAYALDGDRFRVNLHWQKGKIALTARVIPKKVPTAKELGLEPAILEACNLKQGLILVTGPTGSGKSTTLAAMIDKINAERTEHIITMEDPIEFFFENKKSVIEQREVGRDTLSFANALKRVLRQDPDIILIGEMRDLETISTALTAAETGHLVLSTLHTSSAAETIERIIDMFESNRQKQILIQMASSLKMVISQRLMPKIGGGRISAKEILVNNPAISNLIRQNKVSQINSVIATALKEGMIPMNKSLENLLKNKHISKETYDLWSETKKLKG